MLKAGLQRMHRRMMSLGERLFGSYMFIKVFVILAAIIGLTSLRSDTSLSTNARGWCDIAIFVAASLLCLSAYWGLLHVFPAGYDSDAAWRAWAESLDEVKHYEVLSEIGESCDRLHETDPRDIGQIFASASRVRPF